MKVFLVRVTMITTSIASMATFAMACKKGSSEVDIKPPKPPLGEASPMRDARPDHSSAPKGRSSGEDGQDGEGQDADIMAMGQTKSRLAGANAVARPSGLFLVGQAMFDDQGWIEYTPGAAPLVLIVPHGGLLTPESLPDRTCAGSVTDNDTNTQDLARAIADAFTARTGRRPHLIINLLHRRKFDGNRDLSDATCGYAALQAPWEWMHTAIDSARADVAKRTGRGLILDLHGHSHPLPRLELGYLLVASQLRFGDDELAASGLFASSSIARLVSDAHGEPGGPELLRGALSLGGLLEARGIPAVPSPTAPAPRVGEDYFEGGYNIRRHGSHRGGSLDAIQIEHHFTGLRDTQANRARYAAQLADVLVAFLATRYGWSP